MNIIISAQLYNKLHNMKGIKWQCAVNKFTITFDSILQYPYLTQKHAFNFHAFKHMEN